MIEEIIKFFIEGFNITKKNFNLVLAIMIMWACLAIIIAFLGFLNIFLFFIFFGHSGFSQVNSLQEFFKMPGFTGLLILFIFDILFVTLIFCIFFPVLTGIKKSLIDYCNEEKITTFSSLWENIKTFARRSIYLNIVIYSYLLFFIFIFLLVIFGLAAPILVNPDYPEENPVIFFVLVSSVVLMIFNIILFSFIFQIWKNSSEFYLVIKNSTWKQAIKGGWIR